MKLKKLTPQQVLSLPMQENDAGATTILEYLQFLLSEVWSYGEVFRGKRPFGNSGWETDLHQPLIVAGVIEGSLDEYGRVESSNDHQAYLIIHQAIDALHG